MSVRRRLISTLCLLSLGITPAAGQQKNPFADWDEIQRRTELPGSQSSSPRTSSPRAGAKNGSVEYFSPKSSVPAAAPATSAAKAPAGSTTISGSTAPAAAAESTVVREKMKPKSVQTAAGSNATIPPKSAWPASFEVKGGTSTPAAATAGNLQKPSAIADRAAAAIDPTRVEQPAADTPVNSGIQRASIADAGEAAETNPVRTVSGTSESADSNPFEALLSEPGVPSDSEPGADSEPRAQFPTERVIEEYDLEVPVRKASTRAATPAARSTESFASMAELTGSETTGPQQPGVSIQWVRQGDLNVGQASQLELVVENTSPSTVRGVMVEAVLPANLEVAGLSPEPMATSETPAWTFGEMKPGEKRSIMLQVTPLSRDELRLNAFVRMTGHTAASFAVQEPKIEIELSGPETVEVGQQVNYTVLASNPGTGLARNVLIQAAIPEGLEHRRGSLLTIDIGTLNPGESRQAQLNLTAVKGGSHDLAVRVLAEGGLTDEHLAKVTIAEPQLSIEIAGPDNQISGRTEDYALTVTNDSGVPSANVRAKYRVPEGFEFVSATHGGKYAADSRSVEWFLGTLSPGQETDVRVSLKAVATGALVHQAGVISEHGRVAMAEHSMSVEGVASLAMEVSADRSELRVGDEVVYEVDIRNNGSRAANSVGISCELPAGLELVKAAGPSEYIAENGVMVFKSLPSLDPGKSAIIAIKARCLRDGNHKLRVRVASESIPEPLIGEEGVTASR